VTSRTRNLVVSEAVSFAVGGAALLYYWSHAGWLAVGIVLTAEYLVSIVNTVLWFQRTA
jgi:hypothetical protein